MYVYDEGTGRQGQKLPSKLPGWIVAKTITLLRQRECCIEPVTDDTTPMTSSSASRQSKSKSTLSAILEKSDLVEDTPDNRKSKFFFDGPSSNANEGHKLYNFLLLQPEDTTRLRGKDHCTAGANVIPNFHLIITTLC